MVKFYFILCNQFLKSFWSLLWVLYGFLSYLDLRDAWRSHLYTQLWPEISRSWLDTFFLLFSTSLVTSEFTYKHAFSPTAWILGFRIRDRMVSLSEKTSRRPMLLLSPSVWNFHTAAADFQGDPVWGRGVPGWIPSSPETLGSWIRIQFSVLNQRPSMRTTEPGKRMNESLWAGLLGWHPCDPDGIEQLCSVSKERRITCVLGVLRIHQWG